MDSLVSRVMFTRTAKFYDVIEDADGPLAVGVGPAGREQLHEVRQQRVEVREEVLVVRGHERVQHVRHARQPVHVLVVFVG